MKSTKRGKRDWAVLVGFWFVSGLFLVCFWFVSGGAKAKGDEAMGSRESAP
jgi:hypothetical protein